MRIIAGKLGGRQFDSPGNQRTHPMSDKARGGLFNSLGDIAGLSVLDAFAGSGALSFEAISRGAKSVIAIDIDRKAVESIKKNAQALAASDGIKVIKANASGWSDNNSDLKFNIVIAAPPYDNLQLELVKKLSKHVANNGLYILDWPGGEDSPQIDNLEIATAKKYGDAQIIFYKRAQSP